MSQFLLPSRLELSKAAREKITSDHWQSRNSDQITVLYHFHKFTEISQSGEILSTKYDQFGWGAHWISDASVEAIWDIKGRRFVVQDGRWADDDQLTLDVVDEQFRMERSSTHNGN